MAQKSAEREQRSPDADDSRKPQDLTDVTKRSWGYVFGKTFREFTRDQCTDLAAALTYYAVLAIFPALLAIVSLLGVVGQADATAKTLLDLVSQFGSPQVAELLQGPIDQLTKSPAAGVALVVGVLGALWSASGYVGAFGRAMNRVYGIDEGRPIWKLRATMLGVTAFTVALIVVAALILVVSGPVAETVGDLVGLGSTAVFVWDIAKLPVLAVIAAVIVAVLYYWAPNIKQPKFKWMSLGSLVALLIWLIASVGFAFYVGNFSNYNATYGSLGAVIVFLLWLWITNNALLFGAEFDAELERGRELQAGLKAERDILLPPRDTALSEKKAAALAKDELEGMRLRQAAAAQIRRDGDEVPEPDGEGGSEASESDRKKDARSAGDRKADARSTGDRDD